jgi:hypothetical protein
VYPNDKALETLQSSASGLCSLHSGLAMMCKFKLDKASSDRTSGVQRDSLIVGKLT